MVKNHFKVSNSDKELGVTMNLLYPHDSTE